MKRELRRGSLPRLLALLGLLAGVAAAWLICAGKWYLLTWDLQGKFVPQYLCNLLPLLTSLREELLGWQSQPVVGNLLENTAYLANLTRGVWAVRIFYGFACLVVLLEGVTVFCYLLRRMGGYPLPCRKLGVCSGALVLCAGLLFLLFAQEAFGLLDRAFSSINAIAQWFGTGIHAEDLVRLTKTPAVVCVLGAVQVVCALFQAEPDRLPRERSQEASRLSPV